MEDYFYDGVDWYLEEIKDIQSASRTIQTSLLAIWISVASVNNNMDAIA